MGNRTFDQIVIGAGGMGSAAICELADRYVADDRRVIATGEVIHTVEEHCTPDGRTIYVEVLKSPVRDIEGNIVGVQIMFWDVTQRHRAEEALEYERHLLHALLENIPDSIYFKDLESHFVRVSKSLAEKFGLSEIAGDDGKWWRSKRRKCWWSRWWRH